MASAALGSAPSTFSFGLQKVPSASKLPEDSQMMSDENDWAVAGAVAGAVAESVPGEVSLLAAVTGLQAKIELLEVKMKSNHQEVMERLEQMEPMGFADGSQVKPLQLQMQKIEAEIEGLITAQTIAKLEDVVKDMKDMKTDSVAETASFTVQWDYNDSHPYKFFSNYPLTSTPGQVLAEVFADICNRDQAGIIDTCLRCKPLLILREGTCLNHHPEAALGELGVKDGSEIVLKFE